MTGLKYPRQPRWRTWISLVAWRERIISFNASWFVVTMGTGVVMQVLANFPYSARWLDDLAYCFWVLNVVLFTFFSMLSFARGLLYPDLTRDIFLDFAQTSYLGAIPISVDTILQGIITFYANHAAAVWTAYALWWIAVAMSSLIGIAVVFVVVSYQEPKKLEDVTAVWLLSFIPFIVTSAAGSSITPHMNSTNATLCLVISYLCWSLGVSFCAIIISIFFWRLVACSLPAREAIVSCFIPMGPTGMGAYAIQNLSACLAYRIRTMPFTIALSLPVGHNQLKPDLPVSSIQAISQSIHWVGILSALLGVSVGTFFLLFAVAACVTKVPRQFNVGFWSFVFPVGVYSLALSTLAASLRNEGFRGYAAACATLTCLLWLGCALATFYKGVWCAELFFAPGLEGWNERRMLSLVDRNHDEKNEVGEPGHGDRPEHDTGHRGTGDVNDSPAGTHAFHSSRERLRFLEGEERWSRPDGTYCILRRKEERQGRPQRQVDSMAASCEV